MSKKQGQTKTLIKILGILKKYRFMMALSVIFAARSVALTLYVPIIIGDAIDLIVSEGNVDFKSISLLLMTTVLIIFATGIMQWLMTIINNKITFSLELRSN